MKSGKNAQNAIELVPENFNGDFHKEVYTFFKEKYGTGPDDYFVINESEVESKILKKRFMVCSVQDNTGKIEQYWFDMGGRK